MKTGRVAQSAEHRANNARVVSSSLTVTISFFFNFGSHVVVGGSPPER